MRFPPIGPPQAYKTFRIAAPLSSHWRPATCAETGCEQHREGWAIQIQGLEPEDLHAIRTSGRRYTVRDVAEGETWWVFEPGQPCFAAARHQVRLEREELFMLRGGDWRGDPSGRKADLLKPSAWVDGFGENQGSLAEEMERG